MITLLDDPSEDRGHFEHGDVNNSVADGERSKTTGN